MSAAIVTWRDRIGVSDGWKPFGGWADYQHCMLAEIADLYIANAGQADRIASLEAMAIVREAELNRAGTVHAVLVDGLEKLIAMNRQEADDRHGDANQAETWSCVKVARLALTAASAL